MLRSIFSLYFCLDLHAYMLDHIYGHALLRSTCLHACFYAYMSRSTFSHACMLGFVFFHAFMLTSTCLDVHSHAYMHISMLMCVERCVYMLRLLFSTLLYAIIYVLMCFSPCLCAQAQTLFVMPCAIVTFLFLLSHFLMFWSNGQDLIQTLWSLSSFIHQGPHQRVWIILFACQCLLASMLYACASLSCSRLCHA